MILNALYHIISLWCSRYSSFSITITLILCFPDWCPPTPAPLQEKLVPLPLHWRLLHVWSLTVLTMSRYKHVPSDSVVLTSKRWYLNFGIIPFMSMQSQSEQWRNVLIWCHFVYIWTENRSNNDPSLYFLHSSYTLKTFELISLLNFPYISRSKLQRQGQSEEQLLACSRSEEPLLDKLPCLYQCGSRFLVWPGVPADQAAYDHLGGAEEDRLGGAWPVVICRTERRGISVTEKIIERQQEMWFCKVICWGGGLYDYFRRL